MSVAVDNKFDRSHGSLYDRGRADSYYRRGAHPHYYPETTYHGERVEVTDAAEVAEYMLGYDQNEADFNFKDWN